MNCGRSFYRHNVIPGAENRPNLIRDKPQLSTAAKVISDNPIQPYKNILNLPAIQYVELSNIEHTLGSWAPAEDHNLQELVFGIDASKPCFNDPLPIRNSQQTKPSTN